MAVRRVALSLAAALTAATVAGCRPGVVAGAGEAGQGEPSAASQPPRVLAATAAGGAVALEGRAAAGADVRLVRPGGEARTTRADDRGHWRLVAPLAGGPGLFGLSASLGASTVQAEGYLYLTPQGRAVLLRAGAGALSVAPAGSVGLLAVDFDREGSTVVSGRAPAGEGVSIWADGRRMAEGRADAQGRFSLPLSAPLSHGEHDLKAFGEDVDARRTVTVTPPAALTSGPFRVAAVAGGERVDWATPGGGVQSTLLFH